MQSCKRCNLVFSQRTVFGEIFFVVLSGLSTEKLVRGNVHVVAFQIIKWPQNKEEYWDVLNLKKGVFKEAFEKAIKREENHNLSSDERMTTINEAMSKAAKESVKSKSYGGSTRKRKTHMPQEFIEVCKLLREKESEHSQFLEQMQKGKGTEEEVVFKRFNNAQKRLKN